MVLDLTVNLNIYYFHLDELDKPPDYNDLFASRFELDQHIEAMWKQRISHLKKGCAVLANCMSGACECLEETFTFNFYILLLALILIFIVFLLMDMLGVFKYYSNGYL